MGYHAYEPFLTDLSTANEMKLKPRQLATGDDLSLYSNLVDTYPYLKFQGGYNVILYSSLGSGGLFTINANTSTMFQFRYENNGGNVAIQESTAAPTNVSGMLQLFTKSDNKLYFVDGDGNTKEVATV